MLNGKIAKLFSIFLLVTIIFIQTGITVSAKSVSEELGDIIDTLTGEEPETTDNQINSTNEENELSSNDSIYSVIISVKGIENKITHFKVINETDETVFSEIVDLSENKTITIELISGKYTVDITNDDGEINLSKNSFEIKKDKQEIKLELAKKEGFLSGTLGLLKKNAISIILLIVVGIAYAVVKKRNAIANV